MERVQSEAVRQSLTPQTLREQITALAGDLCGYLIAHGKQLNPPDDPNTTGFEFVPDDMEVVNSFEQEFGARLAAVRLGLGNVGMLLGNIGEVLENGAANADDVSRIVDRLRDSVGLLDSRCGTKAPAAPASSPLPSAPIWEGHESEEAWRASITEQNRLITLAHSVDGLLNPAQIEMLWLYKGLCDIFAAEPLPERRDEPDSEARFVTAMNYRDSRILTRYAVEMKGKVLPFYQKLHLERSIHGAFVAMAEKPRRVEDIKSLTTQLLHFALADEGVQ